MTLIPQVLSIGYAVPPHSYTQEHIFEALGYPHGFRRVFTTAGIDRRHFAVPLERITSLSFQEQQEAYAQGAVELSMKAIAACLDGSAPDIGCLVYCSCTGFAPGPTIGHHLVQALKLPPSTYISNLVSHGCEGGFPGLRRAYDYVLATGRKALVVTCELASCSSYPETPGKPDPENHFELMRANAVFADASAVALVGCDRDWRHPLIIDMESYFDPAYMNELGYTWRNGRLRVLLSRSVPDLAPYVIQKAVEELLKRRQMKLSSIRWLVVHAAGSNVLDNVRDRLDIPEEQLALSRKVLRLYGNCSSTTVGIIGSHLMEEAIAPGDYVLMLSVGPGMVGGATLLQFPAL